MSSKSLIDVFATCKRCLHSETLRDVLHSPSMTFHKGQDGQLYVHGRRIACFAPRDVCSPDTQPQSVSAQSGHEMHMDMLLSDLRPGTCENVEVLCTCVFRSYAGSCVNARATLLFRCIHVFLLSA